MADYKATAAELASVANAIRLKGGTSASLEYPTEWITAIQNLQPSSGGSEITPVDPTAEYKVTDVELTNIANAIRTRGGTQDLLEFPDDFVSAIEDIGGGGLPSWATGTDSEIVALIQAAHAGTVDLQQDAGWAVGDVRTINISAFTGGGNVSHEAQSVDIVISSFDDYMNCGCVVQFDFKDALEAGNKMNRGITNSGGYGASEMKVTTLPALVNALPSWLKDLLIEFSVLASAGSKSTTIDTVTGNKLALRSEVEIFNSNRYSPVGEGSQIPYYVDTDTRKKKRGHDGEYNYYWLRSPVVNNTTAFCIITVDGGITSGSANGTRGVAPFGCI